MTTESSVLVNLKGLFEMEADRAEEAVAKERAKAAQAARAEAERRAREAEIEAAREAERRLADEERARRDAALEDRLRTLRDELAEVRAEREQMHLRVASIATRPAPARRGSWMAGVMAAASLVAAVTATAVAWPRDAHVAAQLAPLPVVVADEIETEPVVERETPPAIEAPVAERPVVAAVADEPPPRRGPRGPRPPRTPREREHTLRDQLDLEGGNDVLGDLDRAGH